MMTKEEGERVAQAALAWLGTPHVHQAKVKGRGVDCGHLLLAALEDAGLMEKDSFVVNPYSPEWHLHHAEEWFLRYVKMIAEEVSLSEMQPGDFLMYQFGRCVSHGGIYVGQGRVCHAVVDKGVILTDLGDVMFLDRHGNSRLRGVYRYSKAVS